ncbi:hypothetical protein SLE2022_113260 [Rubroshorea leprosula]
MITSHLLCSLHLRNQAKMDQKDRKQSDFHLYFGMSGVAGIILVHRQLRPQDFGDAITPVSRRNRRTVSTKKTLDNNKKEILPLSARTDFSSTFNYPEYLNS